MEFNFDVRQFLPDRVNKIQFNCKFYSQSNSRGYGGGGETPSVGAIIDRMGVASSKSQGLSHVITTFLKLLASPDQTLYVMTDQNQAGKTVVVGIMKVGYKNLFVLDLEGRQNEMRTLCVLDFYVHESLQRRGFGKQLFEHVLQDLNLNPRHLAIDRPSEKFQNFLAKHYKMKFQIPQANNFVVYDGFFKNRSKPSAHSSRLNSQREQMARNVIGASDTRATPSYPDYRKTNSASILPRVPSAGKSGHVSNMVTSQADSMTSERGVLNDVTTGGMQRVNSVPPVHLQPTEHNIGEPGDPQLTGINAKSVPADTYLSRSGGSNSHSPPKPTINAFSRYNYDNSVPPEPNYNMHSKPTQSVANGSLDPLDSSRFKPDRPTSKTNLISSNPSMQYRPSPVEDILSAAHPLDRGLLTKPPLPPLEDSIARGINNRNYNNNNDFSNGLGSLHRNKANSLNALDNSSGGFQAQNYSNGGNTTGLGAPMGSGGKRRFPNAYKTPPSSYNIFGTMPLNPVTHNQPANSAFRTRLW